MSINKETPLKEKSILKANIIKQIKKLIKTDFVEITPRGNSAITAALSIVQKNKIILIPEEGGWLHYPIAPKALGLGVEEVKCSDAVIDLSDLTKKFSSSKDHNHNYGAVLYQNPGGYFAEQPMKEIYNLCKKNNCLVILDVSGSIGTKLCDPRYADILICSFGEWKLVEAKVGGFIACKDSKLWKQLVDVNIEKLEDKTAFAKIQQKLENLPQRIDYLNGLRKKILHDLSNYNIIHKDDLGFVVVVKFNKEKEKEEIVRYCKENNLPFRECPRYIRLKQKAISIEVKQLEEEM
ncbi:hypothetical protein HYT52_04145 [Candidatus Woesearchaeota archaeon]|nr:hypothetical protein [Candidatus Woesearchaeota archaeon]